VGSFVKGFFTAFGAILFGDSYFLLVDGKLALPPRTFAP
jgi:hypothetical protein